MRASTLALVVLTALSTPALANHGSSKVANAGSGSGSGQRFVIPIPSGRHPVTMGRFIPGSSGNGFAVSVKPETSMVIEVQGGGTPRSASATFSSPIKIHDTVGAARFLGAKGWESAPGGRTEVKITKITVVKDQDGDGVSIELTDKRAPLPKLHISRAEWLNPAALPLILGHLSKR